MSSFLNPATTKSKRPSVCGSRKWPLPPPYVNGKPQMLHAFCRWYEIDPPYDLAESVRLDLDDSLPGWSGASSDTALNLQVKVSILPQANHYDLNLILRRGTQEISDDSWHNIFIPEPPPFRSPHLEHLWPLGGVTAIDVVD